MNPLQKLQKWMKNKKWEYNQYKQLKDGISLSNREGINWKEYTITLRFINNKKITNKTFHVKNLEFIEDGFFRIIDIDENGHRNCNTLETNYDNMTMWKMAKECKREYDWIMKITK